MREPKAPPLVAPEPTRAIPAPIFGAAGRVANLGAMESAARALPRAEQGPAPWNRQKERARLWAQLAAMRGAAAALDATLGNEAQAFESARTAARWGAAALAEGFEP